MKMIVEKKKKFPHSWHPWANVFGWERSGEINTATYLLLAQVGRGRIIIMVPHYLMDRSSSSNSNSSLVAVITMKTPVFVCPLRVVCPGVGEWGRKKKKMRNGAVKSGWECFILILLLSIREQILFFSSLSLSLFASPIITCISAMLQLQKSYRQ